MRRVFSGAEWEKKVGYCRAVQVGPHIFVSGTVAVGEDGMPFAPGDAYRQTQRCLAVIARALEPLGAPLAAVVRTRLFVSDISRWSEIGRAHAETFGSSPPACSMVQVARLIHPDFLVEVEADALWPQD